MPQKVVFYFANKYYESQTGRIYILNYKLLNAKYEYDR